MIREGTVFIIGAGASAPYGFPVGSGFRDDICLNFRKDIEKFGVSSIDVLDMLEQADEFVERFRKSQILIDKWLSLNRRFENIGKLAIVNSIVKHEKLEELFLREKKININPRIGFQFCLRNWFRKFLSLTIFKFNFLR